MAAAVVRLLVALTSDLADECVLPYLDIGDICHVEALDRRFQDALMERCILWRCARRVLPRFHLGPSLAEAPLRRDMRGLVATLRRATVVSCGAPLSLPDAAAAQALVASLQRADAWASAHLAAGGKVARVFAARFRFPHLAAGASPASPTPPPGAGALASRSGGWPGLYPSDPVQLPPEQGKAVADMEDDKASAAAAAVGIGDNLELRLAWLRDAFLINVQSRETAPGAVAAAGGTAGATPLPMPHVAGLALAGRPPEDHGPAPTGPAPPAAAHGARAAGALGVAPHQPAPTGAPARGRMALDLRSASADLFLCIRGMQIDVDAGWLKGTGVCSVARDRSAAARALANGLVCVVCVRDVLAGEGPGGALPPSNVHALHLEVSRLHGTWR